MTPADTSPAPVVPVEAPGSVRVDAVALAPRWHTVALIALIVSVAVAGTLLRPAAGAADAVPAAPMTPAMRVLAIYLPMLLVQWGLVVYVARVGRPRSALGSLLGRGWTPPRRALANVALGLVMWGVILAVEVAWRRVRAVETAPSVTSILPQAWLERGAWAVVATSVGFCEEVVYRGYLQTQLTAFTGSWLAAVLIQAALFGVAHGEQGLDAALRIALYGVLFGLLARWQRSLWPGIVGHAWTDLASGLLRP